MYRRLVIAGFAVAGLSFAAAPHAAAWGNGCLDGQHFPNEQTYYAYLTAHPNALVDVCTTTTTTPPTTTPRSVPSVPTSTSTTTAPSTSAPTSTFTPTTSSPATTVASSSPPSTTSSAASSACEMTSSQNSDQQGETSGTCETPSAGSPSAPSPGGSPTSSTKPSALPATGTNETLTAISAVGTLALGAALVSIARRKGDTR